MPLSKRPLSLLVRNTFLAAAGATLSLSPASAAEPLPWMNPATPPGKRAELLVSALSFSQKVQQLHGFRSAIPELPECGSSGRHVPGIPALQIPTFRITNGPVGLGGGDCSPQDPATALPVALGLAAGFDPNLAHLYGDLMGREARMLGLHELESPGIDMARMGQGGRNFEYFGEDPVLAGVMATSEVRAVQANGVIGMTKHYVLNDQEQNRNTVSVIVDDRTLHQLYLLPFEMAVKDGEVGSVMCSYNKIAGTYSCENPYTLNTVLRDQWGFTGYVQSDFGAVHSAAPGMNAGMDFEMPSGTWYTEANISAALLNGTLAQSTVDRALKRRYEQMFKFGIFDRPVTRTPIDPNTAMANGAVARSIGEQTAVLLKNKGNLLPLAKSVRSIVIIGQATYANAAVAGGGGSSRVLPTYTVTPLAGIQNVLQQLGSSASVKLVIALNDGSNNAAAAAEASAADVAIVMAGVVTTEGRDRVSLSLPDNQDALISAVAAANPRTVVVLKDGDPVLMPWIEQVPAVLEAWNPGQEDGNVVARLLFGLANPSGKLPVTYPRLATDTPTNTAERYPGTLENGIPTVRYSEGLALGYRWYDSQKIAPLFPFGFGLSYTSFKISKLEVTPKSYGWTQPIRVKFFVENTGTRSGAEVAQVYVGMPASLGEPPKRLVAFQKVFLKPGEKRSIQISINPQGNSHPFSYWDSKAQKWTIAAGKYQVYVGNSSNNIVARDEISMGTTWQDREYRSEERQAREDWEKGDHKD
jgi:beta-glucosidase